MAVDLSPYKLLVLPACMLQSSQSEENAVQMQMLWAVHSNGPPIWSRFSKQLIATLRRFFKWALELLQHTSTETNWYFLNLDLKRLSMNKLINW